MRGVRLGVILGLAATMAHAPTAWAQTSEARTPESAAPNVVDDVVVTGVSPAAVDAFVDGLTEPARLGRHEGQIARWRDPVCLRVIGGALETNAALEAKIDKAMVDLGGVTGRTRCTPNAIVVVAAEADRFAAVFAQRYRARFFQRGRYEQSGFISPSRAVRWRHRTRTAGAASASNSDVEKVGGAPQIRGSGSRLTVPTIEMIDRALLVVDPARLDLIASDALAEYLAFVILVDVPPGVETEGRQTILNLFDDGSARLSPWDRAFVEALYESAPNQRFLSQSNQIQRLMQRRMSGVAAAGTD